MAVTRKDVAQRAAVAVSTAGMILAGRGDRYSAQTREKVLRAAKQLNYRPNLAGRSLRTRRSYLVGVLLNAANTTMAADFLRGVQDQLTGGGCAPVVFSHRSPSEESRCLQCCLDRRVDGLIVNVAVDADGRVDESRYDAVLESRLPAVEVFGRFLRGTPAANLDNASAGRIAARHLIQLGHRRIAMLVHEGYDLARQTGVGLHFDAWERYRGYEQALHAAGLEPIVVRHRAPPEIGGTEEFLAGGIAALRPLLAHPAQPTAVVCYNDYQAVGLIRAARQQNVPLPQRLSIVGYGDTELARITDPTLTTLRIPAFEIGCETARMLLERIEGRTVESVAVPCEMVARESAVGRQVV